MNKAFFYALFCIAILCSGPVRAAQPATDPAKIDAATRLQVFLDRAGFGPGKIDGRFGTFTQKAANLYLESNGREPVQDEAQAQQAFADEISTVGTPFIEYTVAVEDQDRVAKLPKSKDEQGRLKWIGYETVGEAVAERFHADPKLLTEINPGLKLDTLAPGAVIMVPNVEPFDLKAIEAEKQERIARAEEEEREQKKAAKSGRKNEDESAPPVASGPLRSIQIGTAEAMLKVMEGDKLLAAFPVTCGSEQIPSPIGEWKVRSVNLLPIFRWDKQMLKTGKRGGDAIKMQPGPNNQVGVVWIALDKDGVGIHGTDVPETIGRTASHGCIRLANWDAIRVAHLVEKDSPVTITP